MKANDVLPYSRAINAIGRPITFYPSISKAIGSVKAGVFLSNFLYWEGLQSADNDGWIYKEMSEIFQETALTRNEQESARKRLRDLGILTEKKKGIPPRTYYCFNWQKMDEILHEYFATRGEDEWGERFGKKEKRIVESMLEITPKQKKKDKISEVIEVKVIDLSAPIEPIAPTEEIVEAEIVNEEGKVEKKPKDPTLIWRMKEFFDVEYLKVSEGIAFNWGAGKSKNGKEWGSLKLLRDLMKARYIEKFKVKEPPDDDVFNSWAEFIKAIPDYHRRVNFTPTLIYSNFNKIIIDIKNEGRFKKGKQSFDSDDYAANAI